jgi:hypothetical protein
MRKINKIKNLADRFACAWCYDWSGERIFVAGKADSLRNIESNTGLVQFRGENGAFALAKLSRCYRFDD